MAPVHLFAGIINSQWRSHECKQILPCYSNENDRLSNISRLRQFGGIVVKGFGFSTLNTFLMSIPAYVFTLLWLAISTTVSWKVKHARCFTIAFLQLISIAGCLLVSQVPSNHKMTRLAGIWLFSAFSAGFPIVLSLTASNISGYTKKATVNALVFLGYCTGNILGPFFFFSREYPSYPVGLSLSPAES